ncbi:MAG TPA: MopE-related protein [Myxococcota bacterium]|nr:MopE-related protein [Myxococcota bacterium]
MIRTLPLLLALAACTQSSPDDVDTAALTAQAPPPPPPSLTIENKPMVLGMTNQIRVTAVDPGDTVYLVRALNPAAGTTCLANPPVCVNLPGPARNIRIAATAVANADGVATLQVVAPATVPPQVYQVQAVSDPYGQYELSPTITVRWTTQAGDTDADGLSNAQEATAGTNPEVADTDHDGVSDGTEVAAGTNPLDPLSLPTDFDHDGYYKPIDCNDNNAAIHPGATEVCDGADNDCDGTADGDLWWDARWPYRVPIVATAPIWHTSGAPIAVDVDFRAALDALGDSAPLDPRSVRVVRQDCALGNPEMPSEFADDLAHVFDKSAMEDPTGDEHGAVVFAVDRDGDYSTDELFQPSSQAVFAVYFGSTAHGPGVAAPSYPSGLVATSDGTVTELSNDLTMSTYRRVDAAGTAVGGMADWIGPQGGPNVGKMSGTGLGQGLFLNVPGGGPNGAWLSARGDANAQLSVMHEGPILSVVTSRGTRAMAAGAPVQGGFDYRYDYFLFDGRPEIYAKVTMTINQDGTHLGPQGAAWTAAVRPFTVDNLAYVGGTGSEGSRDNPGYNWVRGTFATGSASPYGLAAGFRQSVVQRGSPTWQADGRWQGLVGQDFEFAPTAVERTFQSGDRIVDHSIIAIYPHNGLFGSVSVDFYGALEGVHTVVRPAEAR